MDTIAHRLQIALDLRGMKQSELVEITGIGKSSISTYLSGRYEPKQRNIYKMAKALNVNEAWLMGEDVPWNGIKNLTPPMSKTLMNLMWRLSLGLSQRATLFWRSKILRVTPVSHTAIQKIIFSSVCLENL